MSTVTHTVSRACRPVDESISPVDESITRRVERQGIPRWHAADDEADFRARIIADAVVHGLEVTGHDRSSYRAAMGVLDAELAALKATAPATDCAGPQ